MSQTATPDLSLSLSGERPGHGSAAAFAGAALVVVVVAALLAGFVPLGFSIVTVFLFAGPHNWVEFRYFLSRMPPRWGPLRTFYLTGILGTLVLTAAYIAMAVTARSPYWDGHTLTTAAAAWNCALVLWVCALVALRNGHRRRMAEEESQGRSETAPLHGELDRASATPAAATANPWLLPMGVGFTLVAGVWLWPAAWEIGLVYLHPFIALWFLDREIARQRPAWQRAYRRCLPAIPVALGVLWWRLADAPPLAGGNDMLTMRITAHAGADIITGVSSHALVATHTFLEMLHYGVWLVAIPLVAMRAAPWRLAAVPIARHSVTWKRAVVFAGVAGALIVVVLWGGFLADYPITRDAYFTVAIGHVLAEATFLLRLL